LRDELLAMLACFLGHAFPFGEAMAGRAFLIFGGMAGVGQATAARR
jgi:hypothetical protein